MSIQFNNYDDFTNLILEANAKERKEFEEKGIEERRKARDLRRDIWNDIEAAGLIDGITSSEKFYSGPHNAMRLFSNEFLQESTIKEVAKKCLEIGKKAALYAHADNEEGPFDHD